MEALWYLNFDRMAEEGVRIMSESMRNAGLPPPRFSPPELDRVTCTLFNNINERIKARTDPATHARITPTTVTPNIYPLRMSSYLTEDPQAPFAEEAGRPAFGCAGTHRHGVQAGQALTAKVAPITRAQPQAPTAGTSAAQR